MSIARDLFMLAALAFQEGKYEQAGILFTSSLSSDDFGTFLAQVDSLPEVNESSSSSDFDEQYEKVGMSEIARQIALAMQEESVSAVDLSIEDGSDAEIDDEDEGPLSDDVDPDFPGQMLLPSSLSGVKSMVKVKS